MASAHSGMSHRLAFIGFMGSGKTTAARAAAEALGVCAVDADEESLSARAADVTVPAARSPHMREVLEALDGVPPNTKLLWATSASADYPAYIGPGLLPSFWPKTAIGRRFLVTDGNVGRLHR